MSLTRKLVRTHNCPPMTGELSLFFVSSDYSVWSPWFNQTHKNQWWIWRGQVVIPGEIIMCKQSHLWVCTYPLFHCNHHCPHQWYCQPQQQQTTKPQNQKWLPLSMSTLHHSRTTATCDPTSTGSHYHWWHDNHTVLTDEGQWQTHQFSWERGKILC